MLQLTRLGTVTPAQKNMLDLAAQGIERIGQLAKSLEKISGMPTYLAPDTAMTESFYEKK